jgi:hypothetical protein
VIGDIPKGAPLLCKLHRHTGQENGGTMAFTCSRCGGSFWQTKDMSHITAAADLMVAAGRGDEAVEFARDAVKREYGGA